MANEEPKTEGAPPRVCSLEEGWDCVRFVVDGADRQTMPFDAYAALYARLSVSLALNQVPVDSGSGVIQFRLSPLEEIRKGRVALLSEDGLTFGRAYKMTALKPAAEGQSVAVIADAATGDVVDHIAWPEMAKRSKAGVCRGATLYSDMLGEFSGRLYFEAMGEIYAARPKPRKPDEPVHAAPAAADEGMLLPLRLWLRTNPKAAYAVAAAGLAIVLISFYFFLYQPARSPDAVDLGNAHSVDNYIASHTLIVDCLRGVDLRTYAQNQPQALRESVARLEVFLIRMQRARLTPKQKERVEAIRYELDHIRDATR